MRFRLIAANGSALDEGECEVDVEPGTGGDAAGAGAAFVLRPAFGQVLRVPASDIAEIVEAEPYLVRLVLADGTVVELARMGALRTQLLAELAEARADGMAEDLLLHGVGAPELFTGIADGTPAQLRLYDDALVVVADRGAEAEKVPYPFVAGVRTDGTGYRIGIDIPGRAPLEVHGLGPRTTEFLQLLRERHGHAAGRTAAFLAALLPGLDAMELRALAACLRDGIAGERDTLDAIDPAIWPAVLDAATPPERSEAVGTIQPLGRGWIGFKQRVSVRRPATGTVPWRGSGSVAAADHGGDASSFQPGLTGMVDAAIVSGSRSIGPGGLGGLGGLGTDDAARGFDAPFPLLGPLMAYRMLGAMVPPGVSGEDHGARSRRPRPDVTRRAQGPASTDHAALTRSTGAGVGATTHGNGDGGEPPVVLAFLLCLTPTGHLVYEPLNAAGQATYVYRAGPDEVAAINRALDLVGFDVDAVHQDTGSVGARYREATTRVPALRVLRDRYVARVTHTDQWRDRLLAALSG